MKLGKNMRHALAFATKYRGWNSYDRRNRATVLAIRRLAARGLIEIAGRQFRHREK